MMEDIAKYLYSEQKDNTTDNFQHNDLQIDTRHESLASQVPWCPVSSKIDVAAEVIWEKITHLETYSLLEITTQNYPRCRTCFRYQRVSLQAEFA